MPSSTPTTTAEHPRFAALAAKYGADWRTVLAIRDTPHADYIDPDGETPLDRLLAGLSPSAMRMIQP